ncbi:MAG: cyclic nucleotide-binding domain-containing protein [Magnetococcales bacterium]|nr:cyclic nucleotide-binding domain-containing protein [Magnetococcales bacterium]
MGDPLKTFLDDINSAGWIERVKVRDIFSEVPLALFVRWLHFPVLYGDTVADIEVVHIGNKISLNFTPDQDTISRVPLNYIFPLVNRDPNRRVAGTFLIGSTAENQFVIPDYTLSKKHALITKKTNGYFLKDLKSEFGSYVNGVTTGSKEVLLHDGDRIALGRYQFIFLTSKSLYHILYADKGHKTAPPAQESILATEPARTTAAAIDSEIDAKIAENSEFVASCIANDQFDDIEDKILSIMSFIPFFESFSVHEKKQIISFHKKLIMAPPQEFIVREKDASDSFFIILKGRVSIRKEGSPIALNFLGPGRCFGEVAFLNKIPRSAHVIALEPTILFSIDHDFYENIGLEIREKIKDQILRQISANIIQQNLDIAEFYHKIIPADFKTTWKQGRHSDLAERKNNRQEIAQFIEHCPTFAKMSKYQKVGLAVLLNAVESYQTGEIILREKSKNSSLFIIIEGAVYVTVSKKNILLAELKVGDMFGETSTFSQKLTSANVIAKEQTRLIQITAEDLDIMSLEVRDKLKDIVLEQIIKRQTIQNATIVHHG